MTTETQELKQIILAQENRITGLLARIDAANKLVNQFEAPMGVTSTISLDCQLAEIQLALYPEHNL